MSVTADPTAGAAILVDRATLGVGDADLIADATLRIGVGERWAIVGPNGCGKSTLLRAILGGMESLGDSAEAGRATVKILSGTVARAPALSVGYLEQTAVTGSRRSVREEAMSRMTTLQKAKRSLEEASAAVAGGDTSARASDELARAQATFDLVGGYQADRTVAGVLRGLGFSEADADRPCAEFSGGWRMRIALAR